MTVLTLTTKELQILNAAGVADANAVDANSLGAMLKLAALINSTEKLISRIGVNYQNNITIGEFGADKTLIVNAAEAALYGKNIGQWMPVSLM